MSITEKYYYGEAIVSTNGESIETVTVASGNNLSSGHVVQKVHALTACKLTMAADGGNTGNGTLTKAKAGPEVLVGTYTITCTAAATHGGTFSVTGPGSIVLPSLTLTAGAGTATWYYHPQIEFLVTDGSTDFAVDDAFTVVVEASTTPVVTGTGNGTMTLVSFGRNAKPGSYVAKCVAAVENGGTFEVTGPDGAVIGTAVMTAGAGTATAWTDRRDQVTFTLTDSSTDFVTGDYFVAIAAKAATYEYYQPYVVTNGLGLDLAVLADAVDATSAAKTGPAVVRNAEVKASALQWTSSPTAASKAIAYAALNSRGISVRS